MTVNEYCIYVKGKVTVGHLKALRLWVKDMRISSFNIKSVDENMEPNQIIVQCSKKTAQDMFNKGREDYLCWISGIEKLEIQPVFMHMWSSEEE